MSGRSAMSRTSSQAVGAASFMIAVGVVQLCAITGTLFSIFRYLAAGDQYETMIVASLLVFTSATPVKRDELIRVSMAHNSFVGIEHLTYGELEEIRRCERRAEAEKARERRSNERAKRPNRPRIAL